MDDNLIFVLYGIGFSCAAILFWIFYRNRIDSDPLESVLYPILCMASIFFSGICFSAGIGGV